MLGARLLNACRHRLGNAVNSKGADSIKLFRLVKTCQLQRLLEDQTTYSEWNKKGRLCSTSVKKAHMGKSSPTVHIPSSELLQFSSKNCNRVFDECSATARVT